MQIPQPDDRSSNYSVEPRLLKQTIEFFRLRLKHTSSTNRRKLSLHSNLHFNLYILDTQYSNDTTSESNSK